MKDSYALTLFRRWGAFAGSVSLAMTFGIITPASAGATDYRAVVAGGCPPTEAVPPLTDPPSPTPVVASGGGVLSGGIVRAASTPTAEVHTGARPTNVISSDSGDCSSSAFVNISDIVIQGPPGFVHVRLHLPFHANFTHETTVMTDGVNQIRSNATGEAAFNVSFFGARAIVQVNMNSQVNPRVSFQGFGNGAEFVPKPRIPGLIPIDPGGFVTLFFQNSLPVTGGVGVPFAGFQTYAIDELRGEIILNADVPANTPLTLTMPNTNTVTAGSFFIMGAFSAIGQAAIGFPSDGAPVFELPDGYTAQVPSAGVIDNVVPPVFKCTQTVASWLSHPNDWPLPFMTLGTQTYTHDDLLGILKTATSAWDPLESTCRHASLSIL